MIFLSTEEAEIENLLLEKYLIFFLIHCVFLKYTLKLTQLLQHFFISTSYLYHL